MEAFWPDVMQLVVQEELQRLRSDLRHVAVRANAAIPASLLTDVVAALSCQADSISRLESRVSLREKEVYYTQHVQETGICLLLDALGIGFVPQPTPGTLPGFRLARIASLACLVGNGREDRRDLFRPFLKHTRLENLEWAFQKDLDALDTRVTQTCKDWGQMIAVASAEMQ